MIDPFTSLDAGAEATDPQARRAARMLVIWMCWVLGLSITVNVAAFTIWFCNLLRVSS